MSLRFCIAAVTMMGNRDEKRKVFVFHGLLMFQMLYMC